MSIAWGAKNQQKPQNKFIATKHHLHIWVKSGFFFQQKSLPAFKAASTQKWQTGLVPEENHQENLPRLKGQKLMPRPLVPLKLCRCEGMC